MLNQLVADVPVLLEVSAVWVQGVASGQYRCSRP